jgi:hypothetical protein
LSATHLGCVALQSGTSRPQRPAQTVEAACVQLFTEAKRHKPSILYIPSLTVWASAVTDTVKATIKGLLDGLEPAEPVLLFAVVDGPLSEIPADVRSWFGFVRSGRVAVRGPTAEQRDAFFTDALENVRRPPTEFPDAVPRKRRVLEELPKAPPPKPREPTAAEIEAQQQADARLLNQLKYYLGPVLSELKRRYKRFTKPIGDADEETPPAPPVPEAAPEPAAEIEEEEGEALPLTNGVHHDDLLSEEEVELEPEPEAAPEAEVAMQPIDVDQPVESAEVAIDEPVPPPAPRFRFHDIDLDAMHYKLYYGRYLTPTAFIADLDLIVQNAEHDDDPEQLGKALQMQNQAVIMVDRVCDAQFNAECMCAAERAAKRKRDAKERAQARAAAAEEAAQSRASTPLLGQKRKSDDGASGDEGRAAKRSKSDDDGGVPEAVILEGDGNFEAGVPSNAIMDGIEQTGDPAEPLLPLASTSTAAPGIHHVRVSPTDPALTIPLLPASVSAQGLHDHFTHGHDDTEPTPEAPQAVRELVLDKPAYDDLRDTLRDDLTDLNVEQLEQLRAALYDGIWRARAEWDRTPLVRDLGELIAEFVDEVRAAGAEA